MSRKVSIRGYSLALVFFSILTRALIFMNAGFMLTTSRLFTIPPELQVLDNASPNLPRSLLAWVGKWVGGCLHASWLAGLLFIDPYATCTRSPHPNLSHLMSFYPIPSNPTSTYPIPHSGAPWVLLGYILGTRWVTLCAPWVR